MLTTLSAPFVALAGLGALAPFWVVAGAAGLVLTRRHYRRRIRRQGVAGRGRRTWALAGVMSAGAFSAGVLGGVAGGQAAGVLGPVAVVLAGYAAFGWLQRSLAPPLAVTPGAALAVALVLAGAAPWVVELAFGAALVAGGFGLRAKAVA